MRYRNAPKGFKVSHWRHLYDACICSIDEVKHISGNAVFVVFDAEPWAGDNAKASEIGISMLKVPDCRNVTILPTTLAESALDYGIETHRIQIIEMERDKKIEAHRFGQEHRVSCIDVEQHVMGLVDSYREKMASASEQIILVGFDLQFEFKLISTIYTRLTNYFTSWLDVQELSRRASRVDKPGLSETLKACGFGLEDSTDLHSLNGRHNAATDTVRAAAVLHCLLARDDYQELQIATSDRNTSIQSRKRRGQPSNNPEDRKLWSGARPKPKELYPYTARVKRSTGDILDPKSLLDAFAEYNPVAVGAAKQSTNRYGWVCLPSLALLDQFLQRVNGAEHPQGGEWMAVSDYDPDIIPAKDMRELKERLHAKADEKREQRRLKRLAHETVAPREEA
ncbi:Ribonuclease H-like protein [Beauveria brongniartii RCEF 3172]|uniref:Ribonuclease H-like protein n=1 Tax=Beauveria brongniartii RCEF 3172 TaxID=1081107 RepID=A0A167E755_9HYPO|nr:Ribonuclease H-like protein [Beauveria brongniartii RCEF 3172]